MLLSSLKETFKLAWKICGMKCRKAHRDYPDEGKPFKVYSRMKKKYNLN